jgi:hypothetical protein
VEISEVLLGQPSAAKAIDAPATKTAKRKTPEIAERWIVAGSLSDIPGLLLAGSRMNEPRPGLPGPKVSFASQLRWGTEPEGWYVDLPYVVFLVDVNYSPLECRYLSALQSSCQSRNQEHFSTR